MEVAVVGAGIAGASTARFLAARGHHVTIFEQFGPANDRGSSHGRSRIVRKAYPDAFYTALMAEAYPMWRELQELSGQNLLHECGLLYFGRNDSANLSSVAEGLTENQVPFETIGPSKVSDIFPALRLAANEVGVFTPGAGWVDATGSVAASVDLAFSHGAELRHERVTHLRDLERFDRFVVCAGAWIYKMAALPVEVTLQTLAYVPAENEGPVWIEDSEELFYGFPAEQGHGVKIGVHRRGRKIDPDNPDRTPDPEDLAAIQKMAERRFGVQGAITEASGCLYTNTQDEDFRFGRIGEQGFFCSACSGHGFKFGPWLGKTFADFVEDKNKPEHFPRLLGFTEL